MEYEAEIIEGEVEPENGDTVPAGAAARLSPLKVAGGQIRLNPRQPYLLICRVGPAFRVWAEIESGEGEKSELDLTANIGDLFVLGLQHNPQAIDPQTTLEGHRRLMHGDDVNVGQIRAAGWGSQDMFHLVDFVNGETRTFDLAGVLGTLAAAVRHLIEEGVANAAEEEDGNGVP